MIRYLKARGTYVLFNTNGTLLAPKKRQEIIDTGLDELRVSLDAAEAASFLKVRGKDMFDRIVRNITEFTALQKQLGCHHAAGLAVAHRAEGDGGGAAGLRAAGGPDGSGEVHLQRLVFDDLGRGLMREQSRCSSRPGPTRRPRSRPRQALGATLGVTLDASGATEPGLSLEAGQDDTPWATCRRPWSLMYFTAHGRALPCCIAPFSARGYENYTLGDARRRPCARSGTASPIRISASRC